IIPAPFDPRLICRLPVAVAKAAMETGVARKPIANMEAYELELAARLDPTASMLSGMFEELKKKPLQRVVFAEAEEEKVLRAAVGFKAAGYGIPVLVGYEAPIREKLRELGIADNEFEIRNASNTKRVSDYVDYVYERLNRRGFLLRDIKRMVKRDRNVFAACMVATGDADAIVTGVTRHYWRSLTHVRRVIDPMPGQRPFGLSMIVTRGRTVFMADTTVNERPSAQELADIVQSAAQFVRRLGHEPRAAFLSFSNFGNPPSDKTKHIREAVAILDERDVDFEYDGEMQADVALNKDLMALYPFMRLSGPANILIMPALHSANIAYKLLAELGDGRVVGPMLLGMEKSVQIARMTSTASDLVTVAGLAASYALAIKQMNEKDED
ncbi:MAG: NADP-dependent malic enzyme, partial [Kordiimonadaceae bacterium]|nr:NADP-dependent malic enzyme [Kordiimonadaceae bacterium]